MAILPVIVRELRMQSRQPFTYWLRTIGAISVFAAVAFALWRMNEAQNARMNMLQAIQSRYVGFSSLATPPTPNEIQTFGTTLFGKLNLCIFAGIWLLVPLATADAISRERRDGTLPLLYLTELRSLGIVLGKTFVHGLRSASLFLTMAPWLMLPLVFGGIGLRDIALAFMLNAASLLLAQSAGLLASTFPRDRLKAAILAEFFALILLLALLQAHGTILSGAAAAGPLSGAGQGLTGRWNYNIRLLWDILTSGWGDSGILSRTLSQIEYATDCELHVNYYGGWFGGYGLSQEQTNWQLLWATLSPAGQTYWIRGVAGLLFVALLILIAAIWAATRRVERSWRDAVVTPTASDLTKALFSPRFGVQTLRRRLSRSLDANPIGWLHLYSTSARMVKWGWCIFIVLIEVVISSNSSDLYAVQLWLGVVLLLGLTFSATGSFREELQNGAFELLLVTPLRERQIIIGRVRGLWRQFLPAMAVYGAATIYLASGWKTEDYASEAWTAFARTMIAFCTLPFIGLYFSVQRWNFVVSWLAACIFGLGPLAAGMIGRLEGPKLAVAPIMFAAFFGGLLANRLRRRRFLTTEVVGAL
jgi:ABC-type transport system involved in multi-copper enzyme maturation permease subunit